MDFNLANAKNVFFCFFFSLSFFFILFILLLFLSVMSTFLFCCWVFSRLLIVSAFRIDYLFLRKIEIKIVGLCCTYQVVVVVCAWLGRSSRFLCLILLSCVEQQSFAGGADSISHGWMERLFLPSLYNNNNNTFAAAV